MFAATVKSYAKVNLALNVTGCAGGYHLLDSVVASVDIYDTVRAKPRKDALVNVYMRGMGSEGIPPEGNNAVRAAEAFVQAFGTGGADIQIDKDIPIGAGLGGSSADAAGALNALAKVYGIQGEEAEKELKRIADATGSDTGYMLSGGFARLTGRGDAVQPLTSPRTYHMLLFFPPGGVSTAQCFARYDASPDPPRCDSARLAEALSRGDLAGVAANVYNALQRPACQLHAGIAEALAAAASFSPQACAVTGSGSAVFALFETEELCRWARSRYRGKCKTRVVRTVCPQKGGRGAEPRGPHMPRNPFYLSEEELRRARGKE